MTVPGLPKATGTLPIRYEAWGSGDWGEPPGLDKVPAPEADRGVRGRGAALRREAEELQSYTEKHSQCQFTQTHNNGDHLIIKFQM